MPPATDYRTLKKKNKPIMVSFPSAKINIGLNILEKRTDGYHNIASIFYPIGWADILELTKASTFSFKSTGLPIPGALEQNLIYKAYKLLENELPQGQMPAFHLHKILPMGAGIGGGSADGAFALVMMNEVFNLGKSTKELEQLAAKMGSDCPFFIENKPRFCYQTGTSFKETTLSLKGKWIYVVNPGIHISTAEAYSGVRPNAPQVPLEEAIQRPINEWQGLVRNDFEESLLLKYPEIAKIKSTLYRHGAQYASMTGSGSTVYGIFDKKIEHSELFKGLSTWSGYLE